MKNETLAGVIIQIINNELTGVGGVRISSEAVLVVSASSCGTYSSLGALFTPQLSCRIDLLVSYEASSILINWYLRISFFKFRKIQLRRGVVLLCNIFGVLGKTWSDCLIFIVFSSYNVSYLVFGGS